MQGTAHRPGSPSGRSASWPRRSSRSLATVRLHVAGTEKRGNRAVVRFPGEPTAGLEPATPSLRACAGPETWWPSQAWTDIKYLLTRQLWGPECALGPFTRGRAGCTRLVPRGRGHRRSRNSSRGNGRRRQGSLPSGADGGDGPIHACCFGGVESQRRGVASAVTYAPTTMPRAWSGPLRRAGCDGCRGTGRSGRSSP